MVTAVLVRIAVDQAYGRWNGPVDPTTKKFVYVPIPDGEQKRYTPQNKRAFEEIVAPIRTFAVACNAPEVRCPDALLQRTMHLDPDFENLTYGDNGARRGKRIADLEPDDLLVFYAGLRSIKEPFGLIYALVGLFVVSEVVPAITVPIHRRHENAHTRWTSISANDVIVRAKPRVSGRLQSCIPIGEWRNRAYRVCASIEQAWGGLSVTDGYIQRSAVPPTFINPDKFYRWFLRENVGLVQRNN